MSLSKTKTPNSTQIPSRSRATGTLHAHSGPRLVVAPSQEAVPASYSCPGHSTSHASHGQYFPRRRPAQQPRCAQDKPPNYDHVLVAVALEAHGLDIFVRGVLANLEVLRQTERLGTARAGGRGCAGSELVPLVGLGRGAYAEDGHRVQRGERRAGRAPQR